MISSATAVPKVNSDPLMNKINEIEKTKKIIEENNNYKILDLKTMGSIKFLTKIIKDTIYDITLNLKAGGLIDLIIKIIQWLISLIQQITTLINSLANLVQLIYNLINIIVNLYDLIIKLINFIKSIITPKILEST
jgi:hypothetical protein